MFLNKLLFYHALTVADVFYGHPVHS